MRSTTPFASVVFLMLSVGAAGAQLQPAAPVTAPGTTGAAPAQPKKPLYDEKANAARDIEAALARATAENRRVLIQWGGNWCGWCIKLHNLCEADRAIKKELSYEYDVVFVDFGHEDKNRDLAKKFGADIPSVPFLTVLGADGKVVINQASEPLEAGEGHDAAKVLEFLTKHKAAPVKAEDQLNAALALGKQQHKAVLLRFGAPWCGWCHKMDAWQAKPEVASRINASIVCVKVDVDRAMGGKEMSERFGAGKLGIPWFAFLDEAGKPISTSVSAQGNVGFPYEDEEIAHFEGMLAKAVPAMSESDRAFLIESLKANRMADKSAQGGGH